MRATNVFVALVTVVCTVAVCTTANADIDKSTIEAGRVVVTGQIDASYDLVVRIDRGDKPIEWRSSRTGGGEFEVVVEASDKIRLDDGKMSRGFVVTTKILTSSVVTYVACWGDLAGTFAIRPQADFMTKDGVLTFADVTLKDGKKLPVSLRLALSRAAAPSRVDDAKDKAVEDKAHFDAAKREWQGEKLLPPPVNEAEDKAAEDKAAEALTKLGGKITRDEQATGKPVIGVSFEYTGVTSESLNDAFRPWRGGTFVAKGEEPHGRNGSCG